MKLIQTKSFDIPTKDIGYSLPMRTETIPAWKAILRECGFPVPVVVLDFETYFDDDYSMRKMSTIEYVMDKRFEVLGLASLVVHPEVNFPDYGSGTRFSVGEEDVKHQLLSLQSDYGTNLERCVVVAHNAPFDGLVLSFKYDIHPRRVIDTLGLARAWNSRTKNDLDSVAKRLHLEEKGETEQFKGMSFRRRFSKPKGRGKAKLPMPVPVMTDEQINALANYATNDAKREWETFTILLPRLSRPGVELRLMQHTLDLFFQPTLAVDYAKGDELILLMNAEIDKVMAEVGCTREEISGDNSFEGFLAEAVHAAGDTITKYMKIGKKKMLLAIAKDDPERQTLCKHPDERVRKLMAARIALDSWPNHIKRIQRIMAQARAAGNKLCVPLKYHGAHTGRWSGGEKINLQNLGSRGHALVNAVRELIVPVPGETLVIADASQIEGRGLAWIAGQWDLVDKFAAGEEIYCGFASKVLGYACRKPKKTGGIPEIEARMKWARNSVGKVGVLGCGYGMGTDRIFEYAGGEIDIITAAKIRDTYRAENHCIVQFWYDVERAFCYTAKYHKACEMPRGLRFDSTEHCDVVITLPSGREIHYVDVRVKTDERSDVLEVWNDQEKHWAYIWGGTITENIVQAFCRDLLAEAILRLEDRGFHVAHHIHDELVMPAPEDRAEEALAASIEEISRRPAWGERLPMAAEGSISKRYGGH